MRRKVMQPGIRRKEAVSADETAARQAQTDARPQGLAMTRMLASVHAPGEAEIALAGGADIIDVRSPAPGAVAAT